MAAVKSGLNDSAANGMKLAPGARQLKRAAPASRHPSAPLKLAG